MKKPQAVYPTILPLIPSYLLEKHYVAEGYDSRFASCARLLQSLWREKRGLPIGRHQPEAGPARAMGSRIEPAVALRGYNFITPGIARLARREMAYREHGAVIEEERLWSNLLSSQPMTFNLFGMTKIDIKFGKKFVKALLPGVEGEIESVFFEHSPGRGDVRFTGDGTALDVAIVMRAGDCKSTFIGIEVKYSETMRLPKRKFKERIEELSREANLHIDPSASVLREDPLSQLFAEHLLIYSAVNEARFYDKGVFLLILPKDNTDAMRAGQAYRSHLRSDGNIPFVIVDLESAFDAIAECGESKIATRLRERYTDFAPVHALIDDWEPYQD